MSSSLAPPSSLQVPNIDEPVAKCKRIEETGKPQTTDQVATIDKTARDGEKGEELLTSEGEKPPFICAIYKRDILSFLPRRKIEELRTVSRRWNFDIATTPPAMLPRVFYDRLEVLIGEGGGYRLTKDGFMDGRTRRAGANITGRGIQREFPWSQRCCKGIKKEAGQELDGQLVFPHRGADDVVVVVRLQPRFEPGQVPEWIFRLLFHYDGPVFRAPNKLTDETAGTLIHFLSHLNGTCVARLRVQAFREGFPELSNERGEPIGALNPSILDAYRAVVKKPLRLYARRVEMAPPFSKTTLESARQLVVGKLNSVWGLSDGWRVDEFLPLLSSVRPHCSNVEFPDVVSAHFMDHLVEFYRGYTGDIESLAQEVRLPRLSSYGGLRWPATCPMEDAQVTQGARGLSNHAYFFVNAASGWEFEVALVVSTCKGGECVEREIGLQSATLLCCEAGSTSRGRSVFKPAQDSMVVMERPFVAIDLCWRCRWSLGNKVARVSIRVAWFHRRSVAIPEYLCESMPRLGHPRITSEIPHPIPQLFACSIAISCHHSIFKHTERPFPVCCSVFPMRNHHHNNVVPLAYLIFCYRSSWDRAR